MIEQFPSTSPSLRNVSRGELCTGCGLCVGVSGGALKLATARPGFERPHQIAELDDLAERKIAAACPGLTIAGWQGEQIDPVWGPYQSVQVGHARDAEIRFKGASGGSLTALALYALDSGMVDAIVHIAADPEKPTRNTIAISRNRETLLAGAGSRYAVSSPLAQVDLLLESDERYLFIGKPCDISALRNLATVDPRVNQRIPLMLSFFCGGIPSHEGASRILEKLGIDESALSTFRYRGHGWPGGVVAKTKQGRTAEMSYAESWGQFLSHHVQYRCKICADAVGGASDLAAADAWFGDKDGYPDFAERDGRSLIIARNDVGNALLSEAIAAGYLSTDEIDLSEIAVMQPSQARRKRLISGRIAAARTLLQVAPQMDGLFVKEAARHASIIEKIRNYLGSIRRIIIGKR